ncbi:MAG: trypsin-like serine protease [Pseudomonadota bacterium]
MPLFAALLLAAQPALTAPVIGGQEEPGFPSVVALGAVVGDDTYSMCSGNLITPRIVLTAAHCGEGIPESVIVSIGRAFFGPSIEAYEHAIGFEAYLAHPDYVELTGWQLPENDVGLAILAEDAPVAATFAHRTEITEADLGRAVKSMGFGVHDAASGTGSGIKRSADLTLDDLREQFMVSYATEDGTTICSGDSGGPQFIDVDGVWVQAAVHSWADQDCVTYSGSTRTDLVWDWVLGEVEAIHGTRDLCAANGWYGDTVCDPLCDEPDPDCFVDTGDTGDFGGGGKGGCACAGGGGGGRVAWTGLLLGLLLPARRRAARAQASSRE